MKRKIIRQKASYTITLPMKWVKDYGLEKQGEVDVQENRGNLIVSSEKVLVKKKETSFKVTSENEHFIRVILWDLYRQGYDKITIFFAQKQNEKDLKWVVENQLLGFEVTDLQPGKIVIENVTEPSEEKQEVLLRRMFLIIKELFVMVQEDLEKNQLDRWSSVQQTTNKIIQYDNFCRRNISKKRFVEEKSHFYWALYNYLSLIGVSLSHLYEELSQLKKVRLSKKTLNHLPLLLKDFTLIYNGFFSQNLEMIKEANQSTKRLLVHLIHQEIQKSHGPESLALSYFGELARLIYLTTAPIIGIIL